MTDILDRKKIIMQIYACTFILIEVGSHEKRVEENYSLLANTIETPAKRSCTLLKFLNCRFLPCKMPVMEAKLD